MHCDYITATFRQDSLFHEGKILVGAAVADLRCYQIAAALGCKEDDISLVKSGRSGYRTRYQMLRDGNPVADFLTDGTGDAEGSHMVQSAGHHAAEVRQVLNALLGDEYSTARRDTAYDFIDQKGFAMFHALADFGRQMAREKRCSFDQIGQGWLNDGETMTFYLGSRNSAVFMRVYTRGLKTIHEGGEDNPLRIRVEVEVKPTKAQGKRDLTRMDDAALFGCSRWSLEVMKFLDVHGIGRHQVGTVWRMSDHERTRAALAKQYGRLILSICEKEGAQQFLDDLRRQVDHVDIVRKARHAVAIDQIIDAM